MKPVITVLLALLSLSSVRAQEWPAFRHDNARSGFTNSKLDAAHLELLWQWKSELPPDPAWDGPARWDAFNLIRDLPAMRQYDACFHPVSDGQAVYFGSSSQDTLTALNLNDGSERWTFIAGGPIRLAPTIDGDHVLFGCDDGNAYCLNRSTGERVWKFNPSESGAAEQRRLINNDRLISCYPIRTGITVRDGIAYFGASFLPWRESYVCAVDARTGTVDENDSSETSNTYVVRHEDATLEGSLLVAEDRLIVPQGRVAPLLFDRTSGSSLGTLPGGGGVTIVLTETGDVIRTEGGGPARNGQVGVFKGKERVASFPRGRSLVVHDGLFYVIDGQKLFAADSATNELKWSREVDEPLEMIMAGEIIFVGGRDHVTAVSAADGQIVWSAKTDGRVFGLAVAAERLIVSTDTGSVVAFSPTSDVKWSADSATDSTNANWESPEVATVRERSLLHRWVFHRTAMVASEDRDIADIQLNDVLIKDQAGNTNLQLDGSASAIRVGRSEKVEAIELKGGTFPIDAAATATLPADTISVEAWARVDEAGAWGGIIGCFQDDGSTEHGWLLGNRSDKFCFAVAGDGGGLTYLTAGESFRTGTWNHLVGTYNGRETRLYVNGSLAASSAAESGPISYSADQMFTVGAYRDKDEFFPLTGALHEIRVYSTPLDATTVRKLFESQAADFEISTATESAAETFVTRGPVARYVSPGKVEISYATGTECGTVVDLILESEVSRNVIDSHVTEHQIVIKGLPYRREIEFQIRDSKKEDARATKSYALDTHFDWTMAEADLGANDPADGTSDWIRGLLAASPNPRGLALVVGADQAARAEQIAAASQLTVVLVLEDETAAAEIRTRWMDDSRFLYGRDLYVTTAPIDQLPAAAAAVVVSEKVDDTLRRLVRPEGGILLDGKMHDGNPVVWRRAPLEGSGVWSHMYGQADNSAYGGEHLSGATDRQDLVTQWIGRPGPRYQTDRQNRKPSPLAAGGRMFLQGQQRMIALDSYSGTVLWSLESPTVMRWNVPHDCSNWCADNDGVYVAAEDQAWFLDGKSGAVARRFELPVKDSEDKSNEDQAKSWGFIARYQDRLIGTVVAAPAIYTDWWGASQWFDSTGGADTHVVGGDRLFSMDHETGELHWTYDGLILHPTITLMDDLVFFVEDKTPEHLSGDVRRISLEAGQRHEIVCLDVATGKRKWSQPIASFAGHVASLYLAGGGNVDDGNGNLDDGNIDGGNVDGPDADDNMGQRRLVLVASESTKQQFSVQTLDPESGEPLWNRTVDWEANHHGKHISRPAIEGDLVYLRPEVLNLADGTTLHRGFPGGHGCSSYTLSAGGMFSRLGETTWWDVRHNKVNRFKRIRTDCWISVVPAQGMLLSAEGGGGCSCGTWLETSLGFLPRSVDETFPDENPDEK